MVGSNTAIGGNMPRNVPRRNGSGGGIRANRGRGGCRVTRRIGKGRK